MITAGIDVGLEFTKIVILDDDKIIAKGIENTGGCGRVNTIEKLWNDTLGSAGITPSDVTKVVSTGKGKLDVSFYDYDVVEAVADASLAHFLDPSATTVVDLGANQTRVVALGEGEEIDGIVLNQKCMGGLGMLMNTMSDRLGMTLEEFSSLPASEDTIVNDGCPVFAELDALELLNNGVSKEKVGAAVIDTVVVRLNSILRDRVEPADKTKTVLIGGLTKNTAVVKGLMERSGIDFIIPEDAEYGGALGAAVIAKTIG